MLIGENHIQVEINDVIITTRIIKDSYPDYEGVIPKDNTKKLVINRNSFTEAIKRISIFANKSSRQIALELSENSMTISTEDPENITTGKETLDCNYDGEPMTIGYNASYLREVLQHQQADEIKIMLNSPLNAGLFTPLEQEESDYKTTLLMPIRLND
jgi:DNA polymerase-3 subunit beta